MCEWTVVDTDSGNFKLVLAESDKEAVKKAFDKGKIVPRRSLDVRPRTGNCNMMGRKEYREFLENYLNL